MKINNGGLDLYFSSIESLGNLEEITGFRGYLNLTGCKKLKTFGRLYKVVFFINASHCENLISLGELKEVGSLNLKNCKKLKSLGKLKIANEIILKDSGITKKYIEKEKPWLLSVCKWDFGIKFGNKVI